MFLKNNIKLSELTRNDYLKLVVIAGIIVIPPILLTIFSGGQ